MVITPALKAQIEADIKLCENHTERNGSEQLYLDLVARYSVIDSSFKNNLSNGGKASTLGVEFDFRPELKAISSKLHMYLITGVDSSTQRSPLKNKISEFLHRGEEIKNLEYHPAVDGFLFSYVEGPLYDTWMNEIKIFSNRYLKDHPLYSDIQTACLHKSNDPSAYDKMMGCLRALVSDQDFFTSNKERGNSTAMKSRKTLDQLLSEDIERCEQFLASPNDESVGQNIYIEITGKYDNIIDGFGNGLYQYIPEIHFYDPETSGESLICNLKILLGRMTAYQAKNFPPSTNAVRTSAKKEISDKVFVVHGHDNGAKQEMARTLEKGGFEAIILHEQPDPGKTVIEKIERYSEVGFAVVLYTECDLGRDKTLPKEDEKYRARQNVVFEHGYLIGKLGRDRVCALVKGNVETPGDINGVVYIPMDAAGAWKIQLAKNMKDVGLAVDMNTLCS